jgi:hypothetical protein
MIDKVFPRKLNSSTDARVRGKDEMIDAVNVTIDDNSDDFARGIDAPSGNFGVLKPIKGNLASPNSDDVDFSGNGRVIGSCVDERNEEIYYFVYSSQASEQGIYKYSKSDNEVSPVLTSKYFNFSSVSFMESNIVYIPKDETEAEFKIRPILFFTDNRNEPRKIDLSRVSDGQSLSGSDSVDFLDFISVCPRTPIDPPVAEFANDPTSSVSNFKGKKGFQFAYQNIYKSGDVSALSTFSKLYVPAAYIYQGTAPNASFFTENFLAVQIPAESIGSEVERVRLLVREGNFGSWFVVDESEYSSGDLQFDFYNDKVLTILPVGETRRQFDSTPKKARAQEVTNNRLFFGNYVEGFDLDKISETTTNGASRITHQFLERPQDFITFDLTLEPEVRNVNAPSSSDACLNRVAAYRLGTNQLPDDGVVAGTQIIFNVSLKPDNNFHMYESRAGYHGSARYNVLKGEADNFGAEEHAVVQDQQMSSEFNPSGASYFGPVAEFPLQGGLFRENSVAYNPFLDDPDTADGHAQWRSQFAGDPISVSDNVGKKAVYGTNAGNPFIIQGKPIKFSGSFVALVDLTKAQLASEISGMFVGAIGRGSDVGATVQRISVISSVSTSSYNIDLQINNLQKLRVKGSTDFRSKLVVAVGNHDASEFALGSFLAPMGYFIVNKAKPEFRLRDISQFYAVEDESGDADADTTRQEDAFFALDLLTLGDFETLTCVPDVALSPFAYANATEAATLVDGAPFLFDGWVCMTRDHIQFQIPNATLTELQSSFSLCAQEMFDIIQDNGNFSFDLQIDASSFIDPNDTDPVDLDGPTGTAPNPIALLFQLNDNAGDAQINFLTGQYVANENQIRRWFGYLIPTGASVTLNSTVDSLVDALSNFGDGSFAGFAESIIQIDGGRLINTYDDYARDTFVNDGQDISNNQAKYLDYAFSLLDGEAGAGSISSDTLNGQARSSVSFATIVAGVSCWSDVGHTDTYYGTALTRSEIRAGFNNMPLISQTSDYNLSTDQLDSNSVVGGLGEEEANTLINKTHPHIEVFDFETVQIVPQTGSGDQPFKSFKTKANHDFGIVFYDQRGRASDVVPLGSHYVPGYDVADEKGPVQMQISLDGITIPPWAWHYQITYAGNSTVDDFVQYSTGSAFVEFDSDDPDNNGNIYVSLNYLQNNSSVSYSSAFGAINYDGNQDFYTFKEGDKIRVLSYFQDNEIDNRIFPPAYEFDIVGTKTFIDDDDNPLIPPNGEAPEACTGQFLILRNNPAAIGFSYSDVKQSIGGGSVSPESNSHFWNNRCVVEIYSPRQNQDAEDRVYYEVGKKFNIIRTGSGLLFENNTITLSEGDVYFRRIPMNMPRFLPNESLFTNLIQNEGSNPRFLDYFVETQTFTDTIIGANQQNWGKPKIVNRFQREIRRDSSITFSDVNNYSLPQLRYSRFDATTSNFKDLPNSNGSIQRLINRGDSLFVVQEDQVSDIPISRTLLSDSVGTDIVVASEKVLGTQRFYAGDYGCSTNPESVTKIGESIYFANKEKYEVYKFNPSNGVVIISEYGLKSYFRELFSSALNNTSTVVKVVGGYDPILDEFVLSVVNQAVIAAPSAEVFLQPDGVSTPDPTFPDAPDVTVEITDLNTDITLLEQDLLEANDTIADLQAQIAALYNQISTVINDPEVIDANDYQGSLDSLNEEIAVLEEEVLSVSDTAIEGIQATVDFQAQVLTQVQQTINDLNDFLAENAIGSARANLLDDVSFTLPSTLSADVMDNTSHSAGDDVNFGQFIGVVEAFKEKLREYKGDQNDSLGSFLSNQGTYTGRDSSGNNSITFDIGYGVPTDESLSDEFTDNNLPESSILFSDAEFLNRLLGAPNVINDGYLDDVTRLFQAFAGGGIESIGVELGIKDVTIGELGDENNELLGQIAAFVEAVYEGRGPEVDTDPDPENVDAQFRDPFGSDYDPDGDGSTDLSPLQAYYDAAKDDSANGDDTFANLRAAITDSALGYGTILDLIEDGLTGFSTPYQEDITDKFANITATTAVRDELAASFYNTAQQQYNLQTQLAGAKTYAESGQGMPEAFYNILFSGGRNPDNSVADAQDIINSLDGQTISQGDIGSTFLSLYGSVGAVLDVLSNVDTGDSATGEISVGLRNQIKGLLEDIRTTVDDAGFNTFDTVSDTDLADIVDTSTDASIISNRIQTWRNLLTDSSDTGAGLAELITNLKSIITPVAYGLLGRNFFGAAQVDNQDAGQVGDRFDSAFAFPTLVSPDYQLLVNLLGNANIAIDSLQEFQTLFGSENPVASIPFNAGTGEFTYGDTGVYGKGFTGDGTGLTATQLITGNVRETQDGNIVSAYDGLRKALDLIIGQTSFYNTFLQDPTDQTVQFADGTTPLLQTLEGDTIIFQGTPQDILSPTTYSSLVELITASLESTGPENPGGTDPDSITNTALNAINSAVQVAFTKTVANYDFATRNAFAKPNQAGVGFTFLEGNSQGQILGGGSSIGEKTADIDGDGAVTNNDLLSFLAGFGETIVGAATIEDVADKATNLINENLFSEFSQTGVETSEFEFEEGDSTPAFISAIATALNPYIPSNKQIIFNSSTQKFELGSIS